MSRESTTNVHSMIYPERRMVSDHFILKWARDLEADWNISGDFGSDVIEAKRQLEDAGYATFATMHQTMEGDQS